MTSVPFVRGVAEFTRLRVDRPAQDLTLLFQTLPSRFEVTTSVRFSVFSPPNNTSRKNVRFLLEGNLETLPSDRDEVLDAIKFSISEKLDVDISRIENLDFTVSSTMISQHHACMHYIASNLYLHQWVTCS